MHTLLRGAYELIGERLKKSRYATKGLFPSEVASRLNCSTEKIMLIESGECVYTLTECIEICRLGYRTNVDNILRVSYACTQEEYWCRMYLRDEISLGALALVLNASSFTLAEMTAEKYKEKRIHRF